MGFEAADYRGAEGGGLVASGSARIGRCQRCRRAGEGQSMQAAGQTQREGISFGIAPPVQNRAADAPGLVETVGDDIEQPRRERRAEPCAGARLGAKVASDSHRPNHNPIDANAPVRLPKDGGVTQRDLAEFWRAAVMKAKEPNRVVPRPART